MRAGVSGEPMSAAPNGGRVPVTTFSTAHLPVAERYRAWRARDQSRVEPIFRTEPFEPFDTFWETAALGAMRFVYCRITGMHWERRSETIKTPDQDAIVMHLVIEGGAHGDMDGRAFHETSGCMHFHDLARPSVHVSNASRTYSVVLPRVLARQWLSPLDDLHGMVVEPRLADLLMSHAAAVHRRVHDMTPATAERLGRVFLELMTVAVAEKRQQAPQRGKVALLRERAEAEIARRLGTETISAERLAAVLKVSRATLFEAFAGEGGVQKHVLGLKLEQARAALAEQGRREPIGDIAHRLGFSDASHLSRAFRARFGMSPRDYRHLADTDQSGTKHDNT